MKRLLTLTMVLAIAGAVTAQEAGTLKGVACLSGWTFDKGKTYDAGFKVGGEVLLQDSKGLSVRTLYTKYELTDVDKQAIEVSTLMKWYAGKRWTFYTNGGAEFILSGVEDDVVPIYGFGASRIIWTEKDFAGTIPASCSIFGELFLGDGTDITSHAQVNIGLTFTRSQ